MYPQNVNKVFITYECRCVLLQICIWWALPMNGELICIACEKGVVRTTHKFRLMRIVRNSDRCVLHMRTGWCVLPMNKGCVRIAHDFHMNSKWCVLPLNKGCVLVARNLDWCVLHEIHAGAYCTWSKNGAYCLWIKDVYVLHVIHIDTYCMKSRQVCTATWT